VSNIFTAKRKIIQTQTHFLVKTAAYKCGRLFANHKRVGFRGITMNQQNEAQQAQMEQQPERSAQKALSRRKFLLQASAVSVPAVLSLKSGKAWGCVELNCTPGEDSSLSNSASGVASATAEDKKNAYQRPQWSSLSEIQYAFQQDYDKWLLGTFNTPLCTYITQTVKIRGRWVTQYKYTRISFTKDNYQYWYDSVVLEKYGPVCTNSPTSSFVDQTPVKPEIRIPGFYLPQNLVLVSSTEASKIISELSGTVGGILFGGETPQQYALAAVIGSLWERHPEYRKRFSTNPLCFPETDVLISAIKKAFNEVDHNGRSKIYDLGGLFKLYMTPL
jgi:hypothetical protein